MASPTYQSITTLAGGTAANSAVPVPASTTTDDLCIVGMYLEPTQTVTAPASPGTWAELTSALSTNTRLRVFWKRSIGGEGATWTFTHASTYRTCWGIRVTGALTSGDPWDGTPVITQNIAGTTTGAVSLTTSVAETLLIFMATQFAGGDTWVPPASFTERRDEASSTAATLAQAAAGGTGSLTATCASGGQLNAWLGALKPVAAAAAGPPILVMAPLQ